VDFSKIITLTFLRGKCDEKLYRLNLALILIGQFMWAEQIKSYNSNTIKSKIYFLTLNSHLAIFDFDICHPCTWATRVTPVWHRLNIR
jgi:hypothetical protein